MKVTSREVKPRILHPSEIDAMCAQMHAWGQFYIGQLGSHPLSVSEWRERELARANEARP